MMEKVITNISYMARKIDTTKFQILHRICLRKYNPEERPVDNSQEAQL